MRPAIILFVCCCALLAEETVEIPTPWLKFLQIPLLDDQQAGPSDHLAKLLQLSDEERTEMTTIVTDFRQDLIDRMVDEAAVTLADASHVEASIPAMDQALGDVKRVFDMRIATLLGEQRTVVFTAMRPVVHTWGNSIHETKEDRVIKAITDDFDIGPGMVTELSIKRAGNGWERKYVRRTADGQQRGSSSSSGGDLDGFEQELFNRLLGKGVSKTTGEGGAAPEF